MDVEDLCEKLKPVIGDKKANRYWLMYLRADYRRKKDIETILNIYYSKLLKKNLDDKKILLTPPPRDKAYGEYSIGQVKYNDRLLYPFGIMEQEAIQHVAVLGRSGSGKTNCINQIILNFIKKNKKFLIFDWKKNYRDLIQLIPEEKKKEFLIFTVGKNISPLKFNPLIPPEGTPPKVWLKKLNEIVGHAYYGGDGVLFLLQKAMDAVYKEFGVYEGNVKEWPTMAHVLHFLENYPAKGRESGWMSSCIRAIAAMNFGGMGEALNTQSREGFEELLKNNCILELDALTEADKIFFIESLLLWIHHYRLSEPERETFKHCIIIEEAHHVLSKQKQDLKGGETIVDVILREIRELGEAVIIVDQMPAEISNVALANTYCTIAFNIKHQSNVSAVSNCMLFQDRSKEKDYLGKLPIGEAIIKLQDRWPDPFLIKVPLIKLNKGLITDIDIKNHMRGYLNDKNLQQPRNPERSDAGVICVPDKIGKEEQELLEDILNFASSGIIERYRRLGFDSFLGNASKEALTTHGLIKTIDIPTSRGRLKILELTEQGKEFLKKFGHSVNDNLESTEHKFWKHRIAKYFRKGGCKTTIEYQMNGGKSIDVMVEKPNRKIAIEVETGKSDFIYNILKCLEIDIELVVSVGINAEVAERIEKQLSDKGLSDNEKIAVLTVKDFEENIRQRNIENLKKFVKNKVVTIAGHYDCDGLTSAALIYHTIKAWARKVNLVSKGIPYEVTPEDIPGETEKIICLDIKPSKKLNPSKIFYVDHHLNPDYWQVKHAIYDENAQSCADLIFQEFLPDTKDPYTVFLSLLGYFGDCGKKEDIPQRLLDKARELIPEMLKENVNQSDNSKYLEIQKYVSGINIGKRMLWDANFILKMLCETENLDDFLGQKHPSHERINQLKKELKRFKKHKLTPKHGNQIDFSVIKSEHNLQGLLASSNLDNRPLLVLNNKDGTMIGSLRVPNQLNFDANQYIQGLKEKMKDITGGGHEKATGISFPAPKLQEFIMLLR